MRLVRKVPMTQHEKAVHALEQAQAKLAQLNAERDAIRTYYYTQKNELRSQRKVLGDKEYHEQLNALKAAYNEQLDTIFDLIRSCKNKIEDTNNHIQSNAFA